MKVLRVENYQQSCAGAGNVRACGNFYRTNLTMPACDTVSFTGGLKLLDGVTRGYRPKTEHINDVYKRAQDAKDHLYFILNKHFDNTIGSKGIIHSMDFRIKPPHSMFEKLAGRKVTDKKQFKAALGDIEQKLEIIIKSHESLDKLAHYMSLEAGKKSYAVSFLLQDETKTLTDKQIDAIMNKIIANITKQFNAKLR